MLLSALSLWGAEPEHGTIKEGFERGIERYQRDACDVARETAKRNYEIVEIDAGCRCERGDDRQWHCDIGFTYRTHPEE